MLNLFNLQKQPREELFKYSAILGLIGNLILFSSKLFIGLFSGAISLVSDAFNNLLDFTNSLITFLAAYILGKPADKDHPYGHGRMEYISAQFVSFFILFVGINLLLKSMNQITNPVKIAFSPWLYVVLIISVGIKGLFVFFNHQIYKYTKSDLIEAVMLDSKMDVLSSLMLLGAMVAQFYTSFPIDGFAGVIISLMLLIQGISILKKALSKLMGHQLSEDSILVINEIINSHPKILGYHNLKGHDYGPNHVHVSVDIELPDTMDLVVAHNIVDEIEKQLNKDLGIDAVCHIDPISSNDELNEEMIKTVLKLSQGYFHESDIIKFSCVEGHLRTSVFITLDDENFNDKREEFITFVQQQAPHLSFHINVK